VAETEEIDYWLSRLDKWLRQSVPDIHSHLAAGIEPSYWLDLEAVYGFSLPEEYRELYEYSDGFSKDFCRRYLSGGRIMSVKDAVSYWRTLKELSANGAWIADKKPPFNVPENWWDSRWIPLVDHRDGNLTCVDAFGSFGGTQGQLVEYIHDYDQREISYASLTMFVMTIVRLVEDGQLFDENGRLDFDSEELSLMVEEINKGYPKFFPAETDSDEYTWGEAIYNDNSR
jgi:cell wall assembly regulator SMI1